MTSAASGAGAPCPAADGESDFCFAGDGACPLDIDCEGEWSECDENCTQEYFVLEERSGNGAECANESGAVALCAAGEGLCPFEPEHEPEPGLEHESGHAFGA